MSSSATRMGTGSPVAANTDMGDNSSHESTKTGAIANSAISSTQLGILIG